MKLWLEKIRFRWQTKEVKVRPKTDDHDIQFKVTSTKRFLIAGNKVKITVRFRGRELAHRDIGADQCMRIARACDDLCVIESHPRMEGRQMFMILAPSKKVMAAAKKAEVQAAPVPENETQAPTPEPTPEPAPEPAPEENPT